MTRKQKHLARESAALAVVIIVAASVVLPTLVSARDSLAVLIGIVAGVSILVWAASLAVRFIKEVK